MTPKYQQLNYIKTDNREVRKTHLQSKQDVEDNFHLSKIYREAVYLGQGELLAPQE